MKPLEIFRAGRHTAMNGTTLDWSAAQLQAVAAAYDPKASEAPIVVGHPSLNAPAYGWVEKLTVDGDKLLAHARQVDPAFVTIVNEGRFKKISASFMPPGHARNPKRGSYYLNHVGFLGAHPPAVQGLKPAEFAADGDGILSFGEDDGGTLDHAAMSRRLAELEARERERRERDTAALVDGLVKEGRVMPFERDGMIAFMSSLDDNQVLSFADANVTVTVSLAEFMTKFLKSIPPRVHLGEYAGTAAGIDFAEGDDPRAVADEIDAFMAKEAKAGRAVDRTAAATRILRHRRNR